MLVFSGAAESAELHRPAAASPNVRSPHPSCPLTLALQLFFYLYVAFHRPAKAQMQRRSRRKTPTLSCCSGCRGSLRVQAHRWKSSTAPHQVFSCYPTVGSADISFKKSADLVSGSLLGAVVGQVQRLPGGDAPVVRFQAELVVAQSGLVEHRQPLHRVRRQGLRRGRETRAKE